LKDVIWSGGSGGVVDWWIGGSGGVAEVAEVAEWRSDGSGGVAVMMTITEVVEWWQWRSETKWRPGRKSKRDSP